MKIYLFECEHGEYGYCGHSLRPGTHRQCGPPCNKEFIFMNTGSLQQPRSEVVMKKNGYTVAADASFDPNEEEFSEILRELQVKPTIFDEIGNFSDIFPEKTPIKFQIPIIVPNDVDLPF